MLKLCLICRNSFEPYRQSQIICSNPQCRRYYNAEKKKRGKSGAVEQRLWTAQNRSWGEPSWYSLLEEIDRCGMSIVAYAEMFNRDPEDVVTNLEIARQLGHQRLAEIRKPPEDYHKGGQGQKRGTGASDEYTGIS